MYSWLLERCCFCGRYQVYRVHTVQQHSRTDADTSESLQGERALFVQRFVAWGKGAKAPLGTADRSQTPADGDFSVIN